MSNWLDAKPGTMEYAIWVRENLYTALTMPIIEILKSIRREACARGAHQWRIVYYPAHLLFIGGGSHLECDVCGAKAEAKPVTYSEAISLAVLDAADEETA